LISLLAPLARLLSLGPAPCGGAPMFELCTMITPFSHHDVQRYRVLRACTPSSTFAMSKQRSRSSHTSKGESRVQFKRLRQTRRDRTRARRARSGRSTLSALPWRQVSGRNHCPCKDVGSQIDAATKDTLGTVPEKLQNSRELMQAKARSLCSAMFYFMVFESAHRLLKTLRLRFAPNTRPRGMSSSPGARKHGTKVCQWCGGRL
jgi:hypothetical protein